METLKYWKKGYDVVVCHTKPSGSGWKEITEEEYIQVRSTLNQIAELKCKLSCTDYKAIKYAEGQYTEEEYAPVKAAREELRVQIRQLLATLE